MIDVRASLRSVHRILATGEEARSSTPSAAKQSHVHIFHPKREDL
jgi:hypothetical protein